MQLLGSRSNLLLAGLVLEWKPVGYLPFLALHCNKTALLEMKFWVVCKERNSRRVYVNFPGNSVTFHPWGCIYGVTKPEKFLWEGFKRAFHYWYSQTKTRVLHSHNSSCTGSCNDDDLFNARKEALKKGRRRSFQCWLLSKLRHAVLRYVRPTAAVKIFPATYYSPLKRFHDLIVRSFSTSVSRASSSRAFWHPSSWQLYWRTKRNLCTAFIC